MDDKRKRPAGEPGVSKVIAATDTSMAPTSDIAPWSALINCPQSSLKWAATGYRVGLAVGLDDGRQQIMQALSDAGRTVATRSARTSTSSDQPSWDELLQRRQTTHEFCPRKCLRCSTCIHAEAWQRRGGRPFLGIEQERALRSGVKNLTPEVSGSGQLRGVAA